MLSPVDHFPGVRLPCLFLIWVQGVVYPILLLFLFYHHDTHRYGKLLWFVVSSWIIIHMSLGFLDVPLFPPIGPLKRIWFIGHYILPIYGCFEIKILALLNLSLWTIVVDWILRWYVIVLSLSSCLYYIVMFLWVFGLVPLHIVYVVFLLFLGLIYYVLVPAQLFLLYMFWLIFLSGDIFLCLFLLFMMSCLYLAPNLVRS